VSVRPGVYKLPMVRMTGKTDESANVRVWISTRSNYLDPFGSRCGKVKFDRYEIPYAVTGSVQPEGPKQKPKGKYV